VKVRRQGDPASTARMKERAIVLVVAGAGLACATWDRGGSRSG